MISHNSHKGAAGGSLASIASDPAQKGDIPFNHESIAPQKDGDNMTHDEKYKDFNRMIEEAAENKTDVVVVAWPEVLGDNYNEIIENLGKLADADLTLGIAGRKTTGSQNPMTKIERVGKGTGQTIDVHLACGHVKTLPANQETLMRLQKQTRCSECVG